MKIFCISSAERGLGATRRPQGLRLLAVAGLAMALAWAGGCSPKRPTATRPATAAASAAADEPGVLVRVGTRVITIEDFNREVQWRLKNGRALPPDKQALLAEMIGRELRLQ